VNTENLSPAMTKAIEAGGTNNTVIGNALVKRGIFMEAGTGPEPSAGHPFRFFPIAVQIETVPSFENGPSGVGCFPPAGIANLNTIEGADVMEAVRVPAATVSRSPEEIAEDAAVKQADGDRAAVEAEMQKYEIAITNLALPAHDWELAKAEMHRASGYYMAGNHIEALHIYRHASEMWARVVRLRSEFPDAPEWRQENIKTALMTMGTVVYPEGTPEHAAYREELTAALREFAEPEPTSYRIEFERIGRYNPGPITVSATLSPEEMAKEVRRYAARFLVTRYGFVVTVDVDARTVRIEGGRFGAGTLVPITE
jgi:hypothetical protein